MLQYDMCASNANTTAVVSVRSFVRSSCDDKKRQQTDRQRRKQASSYLQLTAAVSLAKDCNLFLICHAFVIKKI